MDPLNMGGGVTERSDCGKTRGIVYEFLRGRKEDSVIESQLVLGAPLGSTWSGDRNVLVWVVDSCCRATRFRNIKKGNTIFLIV